MATQWITVEVAYARPERQEIIAVQVPEGTSAYDAVSLSGIEEQFPEIDRESQSMGIFGKVLREPKRHSLREGDRVEIYRPLKIDPKEARANRAKTRR